MCRLSFFIFLMVLSCLPGLAQAKDAQLLFPADCTLGKDCWTVNYVDTASGPEAKDFMCGHKTYEGHEGTDFAVRSLAEVSQGVNVLAAADGTVLRLRDGEPDSAKTAAMLDTIKAEGKECGNGIIIRHSQTFQTFYCHLKQGSLTLTPGQTVKAGDVIAQIGQSGLAEFPHLHFSVIEGDHHIDPFTGLEKEGGCGLTKPKSLWKQTPDYEPFAIFDAGFTSKSPNFSRLQDGKDRPDGFLLNPPALVFWAGMYGLAAGDKITMILTDPNGHTVSERTIAQDRSRARQYYFTGRKLGSDWPEGLYKASIRIKRAGYAEKQFETTIRLEK